MYFSAERLALANKTVTETFEQTCVAWQAIPQWKTGDPSMTQVPSQLVNPPPPPFFLGPPLTSLAIPFQVTLAQAVAPSPDEMIALVIANTVKLAALVDNTVFPLLRPPAPVEQIAIPAPPTTQHMLDALLDARAKVETGGYRSPSCLITNTHGLKELTALTTAAIPATDVLLAPAHINSLQRVAALENPVPVNNPAIAYLLGRRQRIAPERAMDASAGEEAIDLAVTVPPSLEVVGDTINFIQLNIRITFMLRIKDVSGFVVILDP